MVQAIVDSSPPNELIAALPGNEFAQLEPQLTRVGLKKGQRLEQPGEPIDRVYFVEAGVACVVASAGVGRRGAVAMIGREGMSGTTRVLDADRSPFEIVMETPGHALGISAVGLTETIGRSVFLRRLLSIYAHTLATQIAYTALANSDSTLKARLARWILMAHDRVEGDRLPFTHDALAAALRVRRASVTISIHELEGRGLIGATPGKITIRDRAGLEQLVGRMYGLPEAEYRRLVGRLHLSAGEWKPQVR